MESLTYNNKKREAEKQLETVKDMCEKLKKKQKSLMGAFVSTHGRSIDDVDRSILEARTALIEVTKVSSNYLNILLNFYSKSYHDDNSNIISLLYRIYQSVAKDGAK